MIRAQTSRPAFETWVANTTGMGFFPDGVFGVKAPNGFIAEMLNDRMYLVIAGVLGDVLGREVEVRFIDESQDQRGRV